MIAGLASTFVLTVLASGGAVAAQPAATEPVEVPCPVAELDPPPDRPPQPTPPPHLPGERELGGEALATAGLVVPPGAPDPPADLTATSWLVADLDTGAVLGGCGPHEYVIPASTQKLLLAATLLPELDSDEKVTVRRADLDFESGSSAVGLVAGGEYRVRTLWLGLLLDSGNDAARVLARVGGGEEGIAGTVAAMNREARRLGAYQTHAATPSGLDGPGQFTSAYDLALITRSLFERRDFRRYTGTERTDIPAQPERDAEGFQIQNNNRLLTEYRGAIGGKTGFTTLARHGYVGVARRDGRRLVVTLLGAEAQPLRAWQQGAALLDWGFSLPGPASVGRLVEPAELEEEVATSSTTAPTAPATPPRGSPAPRAGAAVDPAGLTVVGALAAVAALALVALLVANRRRRGGG